MTERTGEIDPESGSRISPQIFIIGTLISLTITSVSFLHTNLYEFIILRFPGVGKTETSLFDTVLYIAYLILGILTGVLANHLGKRKAFLLLGSSGNIALFWLMTTTLNFPLLLLYRFVQGCCTVLCWQVLMTLTLDISTGENRGKHMGVFGIFLVVPMALGPIGGALFAERGVFLPYYAASGMSAMVLVISAVWLEEPAMPKERPGLKENLIAIQEYPSLIIPGIFNFVDRLHMGFIVFTLPLFLQEVLGQSPTTRGLVLGIYATPFLLLQYPVGRFSDKKGRYGPLILGSLGYGLILTMTGFIGAMGLTQVVACFVVLGIFSGLTGPPAMALVGDVVRPEDNAVGMGFFNFLGNLGIIVGPLLGGILADLSGYGMAFLVAGILELVSLGVVVGLRKKFF